MQEYRTPSDGAYCGAWPATVTSMRRVSTPAPRALRRNLSDMRFCHMQDDACCAAPPPPATAAFCSGQCINQLTESCCTGRTPDLNVVCAGGNIWCAIALAVCIVVQTKFVRLDPTPQLSRRAHTCDGPLGNLLRQHALAGAAISAHSQQLSSLLLLSIAGCTQDGCTMSDMSIAVPVEDRHALPLSLNDISQLKDAVVVLRSVPGLEDPYYFNHCCELLPPIPLCPRTPPGLVTMSP